MHKKMATVFVLQAVVQFPEAHLATQIKSQLPTKEGNLKTGRKLPSTPKDGYGRKCA